MRDGEQVVVEARLVFQYEAGDETVGIPKGVAFLGIEVGEGRGLIEALHIPFDGGMSYVFTGAAYRALDDMCCGVQDSGAEPQPVEEEPRFPRIETCGEHGTFGCRVCFRSPNDGFTRIPHLCKAHQTDACKTCYPR